ncbi:nucleoside diphosphate kinase [Obelidium mucronatum]|nr:nucleoside diphosphate kinase [Obelidium mucronatum]
MANVLKPGLRAHFAGPCEPMASIFKRIKVDYGDKVGFIQAQNDHISCLEGFRDQSCPAFIFVINRILVRIIRGANAPQIEKTIKEHLDLEDNGQPHHQVESDDLTDPIISFVSPPAPAAPPEPEPDQENNEEDGEDEEYPQQQMLNADVLQALENTPLEEEGPAERTLAMLKPDAMFPSIIEEVLSTLYHHRFQIVNMQKIWLNKEQAAELYKECAALDGPVLAMELSRANAIQAWRDIVGPRDPRDAKKDAPKSLDYAGLYGQDRLINSFHASDGPVSSERELGFIFGGPPETFLALPFAAPDASAKGTNYNGLPQKTLAVIKPHCMLKVDQIIAKIVARGIHITKRDEVMLSVERAQELSLEFLETPAFEESVQSLMTAPVLCLTLKAENVIEAWLEMLGPSDPATAQLLFPIMLFMDPPNIDLAIQQLHSFFPHYLNKSASMGSIFKTPMGSRRASLAGSRALLANDSMRASPASMIYTSTMGLGGVPFMERTLALLKPDVYPDHKDKIMAKIKAEGFTIVGEKEVVLDKGRADEFYREQQGKPFFEDLTNWMSNTPVYAMVLERSGAVKGWRLLMGPTNSDKAREEFPQSIRALFGTDGLRNAVHGADSPAEAARQIGFFFGSEVSPKPETQRTLALIKPDAYPSRKKEIVSKILKGGFDILKEAEVQFDMPMAKEFYKEHSAKGFFEELITWMSSAPIYALAPQTRFAARETAPYSIRAQYGTDGSYNAVHGSDSLASAEREIMLVFGDIDAPVESEPVTETADASPDTLEEVSPESVSNPATIQDDSKPPQEPKTTSHLGNGLAADSKVLSAQNLGPGSKAGSKQVLRSPSAQNLRNAAAFFNSCHMKQNKAIRS